MIDTVFMLLGQRPDLPKIFASPDDALVWLREELPGKHQKLAESWGTPETHITPYSDTRVWNIKPYGDMMNHFRLKEMYVHGGRDKATIKRLEVALVNAVHRLHGTQQYMLTDGFGMSIGRDFGVTYIGADCERYEVTATREECEALDLALAILKERSEARMAKLDAEHAARQAERADIGTQI